MVKKLFIFVFLSLFFLGLVFVLMTHAVSSQVVKNDVKEELTAKSLQPIKRVYWVAECSEWPLKDGETKGGYEQLASSINKNLWILLRKDGRLLALQGKRLGSREQGWFVYMMRGPIELFDAMKLLPVCRAVIRYKDAWSQLPAAAKQWLANHSVCHGTAIYTDPSSNDWTLHKWPCYWFNTRNNQSESLSIYEITAISPGVKYGGDEDPPSTEPSGDI